MSSEKKLLIEETKAMLLHKVSTVIVKSTDNLILAKMVGMLSVGLYSNYYLIANTVQGAINLIFESFRSSIGDFNVEHEGEKKYQLFMMMNHLEFWIVTFCTICLFCLWNPFIEIWIGEEYIFTMDIVFILSLNFYFSGRRQVIIMYRDLAGLFNKDKIKAVLEAGLNLVLSIVLAYYLGIIGVFLGTIITTVTVCLVIEPKVVYQYLFQEKLYKYYVQYLYQLGILLLFGAMTYLCITLVTVSGVIGFLIKLMICIVVTNVLLAIFYYKQNPINILRIVWGKNNENKK